MKRARLIKSGWPYEVVLNMPVWELELEYQLLMDA